jgi:hypothetical protein
MSPRSNDSLTVSPSLTATVSADCAKALCQKALQYITHLAFGSGPCTAANDDRTQSCLGDNMHAANSLNPKPDIIILYVV